MQCPHLELRITNKGIKTYCFYKWVKATQRPERITIAKYGDISIDVAREKANKLSGQVAEGVSPVQEKRTIRAEITFKALFDIYLERHAKPHKKTWEEDEDKRDNWLSNQVFYNKRLSQITKNDIASMHAKIGEDYPVAANRVLALTSSVFGRAIEWGILDINPCLGIRRFKEKSRERFLHKDEIPKFFAALDKLQNKTTGDFFKTLLFTGARRSNVLHMRWEEISFERAEWHIKETKNGTEQRVPLSEVVLAILEQRKDNKSPWVFESKTDPKKPLNDPRKAWLSVLKQMGVTDLRMHDLRRTMGSWQAITGGIPGNHW